MENKKGAAYTNSPVVTHGNEGPLSEAIPKHQHNTAPQHLRLLQYGLKIQNHQHQQLSQAHQHQKLNASNVHPHVHQHQQTPTYQQAQNRPHLQTPPQHPQQQCSYNPTNIPVTHQHFQPNTIQHLHQHQQKIQTQLTYQTHQHDNPLNQHNPQIWVPHQPPFHYHQQQQQQQQQHNKAEPQQQKQTNQSIQQQTKKDVVERKKSNNNQNLRSPSAKRPLEAPVTMQGWLHKQGSEGLMLWKKRWFVLSEYCLFYYKGPEEEKLLGSILLPSYKVSICTPEDKVNKKFAFKCEHANMRTYILAADSQELMMQWVRVLNLACLLQTHSDSDHQSGQSAMSVYNQSTENSDSGFHQQYNNQRQNYRTTPVHLHSSSNTTDLSNPSQQELSQYSQPLYANAPPKPRRLNDGGYSSPSPDVLDRYSADNKYFNMLQQNYYNVQMCRNISKSPVNLYGTMNNTTSPHPEYPTPPPHLIHQHQPRPDYISIAPVAYNVPLNAERRTPDTYGRSKLNTLKSRPPTDYEDVYADNTMYKRPLSPISYTNKKNTPTVTPLQRTYTPVSMLGPRDIQYAQPQTRKSPISIPRPHSADFLEYEVNQRQTNIAANRQQQPRPKSSLDINRTSSDNYFYTEERYAEKMRKSAQYLQKMPTYNQNESLIQPKRAIQKKYLEPENTFPMTKSNVQPVTNYNKSPLNEPVRSRSVLSEGSLSKELDMDLRSSPLERLERDAISPGFVSRQEMYGYNDPFIRSASARLAQNVGPEYFHEARSMNREGERKREESMKRLLEWKQRMLQSPLNRKVNQSNKVQLGGYNRNHDIGGYQKYSPDPYSDGRRSANPLPQYNSYSSDDEASGSISLNMHDTFPRTVSAKRIWTPNSQPIHSRSVSNLTRSHDSDYHLNTRMPPQGYYMNHCPSQHDLNTERKANWQWEGRINVSAGELLGRTHEELVLLLIQLRRQSTNTYHAIEACYNEIDSIQSQLHLMDQAKRMENLQKLEQIKQHLLELEKQYEKGKPLVNLVDNMVKLGSLYRTPNDRNNLNPYIRDRLEFNQQIQERRLLAEEKRDWNRLNPNHTQLQEKVQQLYQLDHLIHEESGTLQGLQQDKEDIERALGGLRHRLNKGFNDPAEIEQARKQQAILENELSRVHLMLAQNSKKLEETVAGNARLEQELLVLKQKLQISRQQRSSPQFSNAGDSLPCVVGTSAMLESDLQRVQQKVGDLQRQRHELSMQVRQLTDKSNNLQQQIKPHNSISNTQSNKKKMHSLWRETDLDTMSIVDHGDTWENPLNSTPTTPLFINTDIKHSSDTDYYNKGLKSSDSASDDTTQNSNFTPSEKQEIKTVRIVKRESERRQRDREKTATGKWDTLLEEDDSSQSSSVLFRPAPVQKTQSSSNLGMISPNYIDTDKTSSGILSRQSSLSSPSLPQVYSDVRVTPSTDVSLDKSPELSPIFKSEAARQIITEMSIQDTPKQVNRRAIPKEKRRHYTTPHNNIIMKSLNQLPTDDDAFDKAILNTRRARDDLDMERALRQRIDAPDVVRSTLSNKELKYNENTIDNILGTPNKITIPERYIPEQLPQLSAEEQEHRLRKVESIKKMLSDTTIISSSSANLTLDDTSAEKTPNTITNKATTKMIEEKKQREHLLQLNQILAKQVMEMSKIVAVKALARLPLEAQQSTEEDDLSPITPLPLYQQRDNFYS